MEKFSWNRVGNLWRYMYPAVKSQIKWYPVLSVASVIFGALVLSVSGKLLIIAELPTTLMGFLIFLAPIALVRHDYHHTTALLPVTAAEKLTMLVLYFVIGMMLLVNVPYYLTCGIVWLINPDLFAPLLTIITDWFDGISYLWISIGSSTINFALIGIVLLSVVGTQRPTISRTVVTLVVSYFAYVVIIGVVSVVTAIIAVTRSAASGEFAEIAAQSDHEQYIKDMIFDWTMPVVGGFCFILGVVAMIIVYHMVYKKLKTGGF